MEIKTIYDSAFAAYGQVHTGYACAELLNAMSAIAMSEAGVAYRPDIPELEATPIFDKLAKQAYGDMPIQIGLCWGKNIKLNCLEYHRDSEFNLGTGDFILLLAHQWEIQDGQLDTAKVQAFRVPANTLIEVYATTLHYAPCDADIGKGFKVAIILPRGTNCPLSVRESGEPEHRLLWARNKWLLAHPDSTEATQGAYVGLTGKNLDLLVD